MRTLLSLAALLSTLLAFAGCVRGVTPTATPIQIHLGWQGQSATSVTVTWRSSEATGEVRYGPVDGELSGKQPARSRRYKQGYLHHARITGLSPATRYAYRCGSAGALSRRYTFRTAPAPGPLDKPLRFVALGDSRTNDVARRQVVAAAVKAKPTFILHTGDLVSNGHSQRQWDRWFATMQPLAAKAPLLVAIGNHEDNSREYYAQLAMPTHNTTARGYNPESFYSIDIGPLHVVTLSTEPVGPPAGSQVRWLVRDLAKARQNPATRWIIAMGHRPPVSCGRHGDHRPAKRAWTRIFERYGVDLTLWGHDHNYQRSKPLRGDAPVADGKGPVMSGAGVTYIVTGGAGAPLYSARKDPRMAATRKAYHYLDITVTDQRLIVEAKGIDNKTFDRLELRKAPKAAPASAPASAPSSAPAR